MTSGLGVGTPGTPATWDTALDAWGSRPLGELLKPAERLAEHGFTVDDTFRSQTAANEARFRDFPASAELFLPDGRLPVVGSVIRNPDLARTYKELGRKGVGALYEGALAEDIVNTVRNPPVDEDATRVVRPGDLTEQDLRAYGTVRREPAKVSYRGLNVYGMPPPPRAAPASVRRSTSWSAPTCRTSPRSGTCTVSSRRAASRSRTGGGGSATRRSRTCRPPVCCPSASPTRGSA